MRYLVSFMSCLFMVLSLHAAPTVSSPEGNNDQEDNESESVAGQMANVNQADVNYNYVSPSPGRLPIIAHGTLPSMNDASGKRVPYTMAQKDFDNLKDCGFNLFYLTARDDTLFSILGRLKNVEGLSVIYKTDDTLGQPYRMFAPSQYEIYRYEKKKKKISESAYDVASE